MSHIAKAKAKGISASSWLDLTAEVSKTGQDASRQKASGISMAIVGGVKRPDKKSTKWSRKNRGVEERNRRDIVELEEVSRPTIEAARAAIERKSKMYSKLKKGKTAGLSEAQIAALPVDFDAQAHYSSDSSDEDESRTVPTRPDDDENDPIVEYEDEFGRVRTAKRSEVPRDLGPSDNLPDDDEDIIIRNPTNHFPTYEPTYERVNEIENAYAEANNPLAAHYDASGENRAKGAGFYAFSKDEEERKRQMEELKGSREETEKIRKETGAEDVRPGEVEGMRADEESVVGGAGEGKVISRAMEKRKRDREERMKLIEAKRRKTKGEPDPPPEQANTASTSNSPSTKSVPVQGNGPDPFAALESKQSLGFVPTKPKKEKKKKSKGSEADAFLAQIEKDMLMGGS